MHATMDFQKILKAGGGGGRQTAPFLYTVKPVYFVTVGTEQFIL